MGGCNKGNVLLLLRALLGEGEGGKGALDSANVRFMQPTLYIMMYSGAHTIHLLPS